MRLIFDSRSEAHTDQLGAVLAEMVPDGTTVALCGTLGAGKTRLVQAIAAAAGVDSRIVVSPTFVLVQGYRGRRQIYHMDAYRIRDENEFLDLGPEEYFESEGITLVEWADRVAGCLPPQRLEIHVQVTGDSARRFEIIGVGSSFNDLIVQLAKKLGPK